MVKMTSPFQAFLQLSFDSDASVVHVLILFHLLCLVPSSATRCIPSLSITHAATEKVLL